MADSTPQTETRPLAFQYNGGFPLAFLLDDEQVWAGTNGSAVVEATVGGTILAEVQLGEWITRPQPWEKPVVLSEEIADAIRSHVPEFPERADA